MERKISQEKIIKKLKKENGNENEIADLIKNYFLNGYDLNELFKLLDSNKIYNKIFAYAYMIEQCYDICDIKKININNEWAKEIIIRSMIISMNESYISELSSFFKIYHDGALRFVNLNRLVNMYINDKNDELFDFILDRIDYINDVTNGLDTFSKLRNYISDKQKYDFLDKVLDFMIYLDLRQLKNSLLLEEFEYIRIKSLTDADCYGETINEFIYYDLLTNEKRKEHIDEIVRLGYTKNIYMLLLECNLIDEEKEKLEKELTYIKDEYYFYYLIRTNIKYLLSIFTSYLAVKAFMESNVIFNDKEELNRVLSVIKIECDNEIKNVTSEINAPVYKVSPKRLKRRNIPNA